MLKFIFDEMGSSKKIHKKENKNLVCSILVGWIV